MARIRDIWRRLSIYCAWSEPTTRAFLRFCAYSCLKMLVRLDGWRRAYSDGSELSYIPQMAQYHRWQKSIGKSKNGVQQSGAVDNWFRRPKRYAVPILFCLRPLRVHYHCIWLYHLEACRSSSSKEKVQLTLISRKELSVSVCRLESTKNINYVRTWV